MANDDAALALGGTSLVLDGSIRKSLPLGSRVVSATITGQSMWVDIVKIEVELSTGDRKSYFQKAAPGPLGLSMMEGAFESEKAVHSFIPEYVPTPIAYGTYTSDPSMHFYLAEYIEMEDVVPEPHRWAEVVAALHQRSAGKSPGGKFGFHTPCYIANVALDATWNVSWEKLYTQQFRSICDIEEARQGANEDLARLKQAFLDIVIPRYLRPLESDGRSVQPTLLHNDLWVGAMKMRIEPPGTVCLHDSGAMWGHSELDLKLFRPNHRGLEKARELYREIVGGVSEPQEDFDARMQLYITVSLIHRSAVYHDQPNNRTQAMEAMQQMIEKTISGPSLRILGRPTTEEENVDKLAG